MTQAAVAVLLIVWFVINAVATVYMVDKERTPMTTGQAVFGLVTSALSIAGVLYLVE